MQADLPYITPEMAGVGGVLKEEPSHFVVEEIPLYSPSGEGEHVYVNLTREGENTRSVVKLLARVLGIPQGEIGYAGLKDRHALATQTFSLRLPMDVPTEKAARLVEEEMPWRVNWIQRHGNKLRRGHLLGNRFRIVLSGPAPQALNLAQETAAKVLERGLPNFFGGQRFGMEGDNAARGKEALFGRGPRQKWLRTLLLNAYQSQLFNTWLAARMARGYFGRLLSGDIAKKTDTGGIFVVEDPAQEEPRLVAGEITYTGPIYGRKLKWGKDKAGEWEREVMEAEGVTLSDLARARLSGTRRPALVRLDDIDISQHPQGLSFAFILPKGSYATIVLREFMKPGG